MAWCQVIRTGDNQKFSLITGRAWGLGGTENEQSITGGTQYYCQWQCGATGSLESTPSGDNYGKRSFIYSYVVKMNMLDAYDGNIKEHFTAGTDLISLMRAGQTSESFQVVGGHIFTVNYNKQYGGALTIDLPNNGKLRFTVPTRPSSQAEYGDLKLYMAEISQCFMSGHSNAFGFILYYKEVNTNPNGYGQTNLFANAHSLVNYCITGASNYLDWYNGITPAPSVLDGDLIGQGGYAGGGGIGGGGNFNDASDLIPDDASPSLLIDSGFVTLYTPTMTQINELSGVMWRPTFYDSFVKIFANPIDAILGLHILPFTPARSGSKEIYVGNMSTAIVSNYTNVQFHEVNCGAINIAEFWGNYLDYAPFTSCELVLPFLGSRPLDIDEIMGKTLGVKYKIDIATGSFVCIVTANSDILYQFSGQCAVSIPICSLDYNTIMSNATRLAVDVMGAVASGGMTAGTVVHDAVNTIQNAKPQIERTGNLGGASGLLAKQTPYVILKRPRQSLAKTYKDELGYPCNASYTLGDLEGFTRCEKVELKSATATSEEYAEIETILCNEGVLL